MNRIVGIIVLLLCVLSVSAKKPHELRQLSDSCDHYMRSDLTKSRNFALQLYTEAKQQGNNYFMALGEYYLGCFYRKTGNAGSAFLYYTNALERHPSKKPNKLSFDLYNNMGITYKNINLWDDALESYTIASRFFDKKNQPEFDRVKIFNNIGTIYSKMSLYDSSLFYYFKGLEVCERTRPNSVFLGSNYMNIANVYASMDRTESANEYLEKAEQLFRELNLPYKISTVYTTRGNVWYAKNEFKSALSCYLSAYHIQDSLDMVFTGTYSNLGTVYERLSMYDSANYYLELALKECIAYDDLEGEVVALADLGYCFNKQNEAQKSLAMFRRALDKEEELELPALALERDIKLGISEAYSKLGIYDSALEYYIQHRILSDSIINLESNKMIMGLETNYMQLRAKRQINNLKIKNLENERYIFYLSGGVFILLVGTVLFFGISKYRSKLKNNRITKKMLIEGAEKERDSISRELHDHVGATLSMASMMISQTINAEKDNNSTTKYSSKAHELVKTALGTIRKLSHDLSSGIVQKFGLKAALEELFTNLEHGKIKVHTSFELNDEVFSQLSKDLNLAIYRVIQELTNNILKHANADNVEFRMKLEKSVLRIVIIDDGVGMDKHSLQGIGLENIRSRLEPFDGNLNLTSNQGRGTKAEVMLRIPGLNG